MSVQFGIWNFEGKTLDDASLRQAESLLEPFAPDGIVTIRRDNLALMLGSMRTGSRTDASQPHSFADHKWLLWDGRIDNRADLVHGTPRQGTPRPDVELAADAFARLGVEAFAGIVGDWAASVCDEPEKSLILAKEYLGTRPLFYRIEGNQVMWSSVLEPLLFLSPNFPKLCESYLAGWMTFLPEDQLTPYEGIYSVPPSSFVRILPGKVAVQRYWNFENTKTIRYCTDQQYEEHFRAVFRQAVQRRIESSGPILAELSGGMDSSSIVCIADSLRAAGEGPAERIDTVTYCDQSDLTWDEMPLVSKVERDRGRTGYHIDIGTPTAAMPEAGANPFRAIPTSLRTMSGAAESFAAFVSRGDYRVILSGIGGDEILGGVPTPIPELADLLARGHGYDFLRQSMRWAVAKKKPVLALWRTTVQQFVPWNANGSSRPSQKITWLTEEFARRNEHFLGVNEPHIALFGRLPSVQANLSSLDILRRQFSCTPLASEPAYEWRYPLMDRDLVSFCFSVPREQMVRPHQRRSLMRRALSGLVPKEILERHPKAYVSRGLVSALRAEWAWLVRSGPMLSERLGILDAEPLRTAIHDAEQGREVPIIPLLRTLTIERWLRDMHNGTGAGNGRPFVPTETLSGQRRPTSELLGRERPNKKGGEIHDLHQA